jgi:hypothetical protein
MRPIPLIFLLAAGCGSRMPERGGHGRTDGATSSSTETSTGVGAGAGALVTTYTAPQGYVIADTLHVGDANGDGQEDIGFALTGSPDGAYIFVVVDGSAAGIVDVLTSPIVRLDGGIRAGITMYSFGDLTGDEVLDFVTLGSAGVVVATGPLAAHVDLAEAELLVEADMVWPGGGVAALRLTDYDLDGSPELVVEFPEVGANTPIAQTARIFDPPFVAGSPRGPADARLTVVNDAETTEGIPCSADWWPVAPVALGDSDGDADAEMLIGAVNLCGSGEWIVSSASAGRVEYGAVGEVLERSVDGALANAVGLGDLDHDGRGDTFVNLFGGSAIMSGLPQGEFDADDVRAAARQVFDVTAGNRPFFLATAPDIDGDGVDEVLVAAGGNETLVLGSAAGSYPTEASWPVLVRIDEAVDKGAVVLAGPGGASAVFRNTADAWLRFELE